MQVAQDAVRMAEQSRSRTSHGSAELCYGEGHVGTRVGGTIEERANEALVFLKQVALDGVGRNLKGVDDGGSERLIAWRVSRTDLRRAPLW